MKSGGANCIGARWRRSRTHCASEDELRLHDAELARHCDAAGLDEKASDYYARAAETAVGSGACREAIDLMNRAITLDQPRVDESPKARR